jgi:hypothetical protein
MSDDVDLSAINAAFEEFRVEVTPTLQPAGFAPVRVTVRRRRQVRTVAVATLAILVIVLPISAYARSNAGRSTVATTPSPTAPSPSEEPSRPPDAEGIPPGPSPACQTIPTGVPITAALCDATLEIPDNPVHEHCPHGQVRFAGGVADGDEGGEYSALITVVSADVNHDGVPDAVALVSCEVGQMDVGQVVAFTRTGTGPVRTLGRLVGVDGTDISQILDLKVNPDGSVQVQVSDDGGDPLGQWAYLRQWRTYGWTVHGFAQTAGSRSFRVDKSQADLTLTVGTVVFDRPQGGNRHGSVTVTVRNRGTRTMNQLSLYHVLGDRAPDSPCQEVASVGESCSIGTLAPGASWQKTLTFTRQDDPLALRMTAEEGGIQLRISDQAYTEVAGFAVTIR